MITSMHYYSTGYVLGNLWGSGQAGYVAQQINSSTKEGLIKKATEMLDNGKLDSGMGFESLIGTLLFVETKTTKTIDGIDYIHSDYEYISIGDLTKDQVEFLLLCYE